MKNPLKKWTARDFNLWREDHAAELAQAAAQNQCEVDDVVFRNISELLKKGLTLDEAGDRLMLSPVIHGGRAGLSITDDAVRRALQSIGWRSEAERKKGVEG